jgi:phosphoribosylformimino-5-aminoimidazole carboxamide ribotide isomerase
MELYPAIDLRAGRAVRLLHGDYERETIYGEDPVAIAVRFADEGARWIHVVDLDAARTGEPVNWQVIEAIVEGLAGRDVQVQAGGGVRSEDAAAALAALGVRRVVMGTAALEDPDLVRRVAQQQPVAVGLDGRSGQLAVRGWLRGGDQEVLGLLPFVEDAGVAAVVVTEIGVDGTMAGPDLAGLSAALGATSLPVIASGGIGSLDDLRALDALEVQGRLLHGAIVGRALYEGRFTVAEAVAMLDGLAGERR